MVDLVVEVHPILEIEDRDVIVDTDINILKKESQTGLINHKPFNFLILRLYFLTCLVDFKIGMYTPLGSVISPLSALRENIRSSSKALTRRSSALSLKNLIIPILPPPRKRKNEIEQFTIHRSVKSYFVFKYV